MINEKLNLWSKRLSDPKVLIYIPTRDTAKTLSQTYNKIPDKDQYHYIVIDNGSNDDSVEEAKKLGLPTIRHHFDRGYGATQKTAYVYAIGSQSDIVLMLHSDDQYPAESVPRLIQPIIEGEADFVFGSRIAGGQALDGGMPYWKLVSNRFLTAIENRALRTKLSEFHSGFRAFRVSTLERIPFMFNSDNWLFDSEIIFQIVNMRYRINEIPIPTNYHPTASSVSLYDGTIYGLSIFGLIAKYRLHKAGFIRRKQFM